MVEAARRTESSALVIELWGFVVFRRGMDGGGVVFEPGGGILREIAGVSVRDVLCSPSSTSLWILS